METKRCTKCGEEKSLTEFNNWTGRRGGKHPHCKQCHNAENKAYRLNNPDKIAAYQRRYAEEHPRANAERCARNYEENRERRLAYQREYSRRKRAEKEQAA